MTATVTMLPKPVFTLRTPTAGALPNAVTCTAGHVIGVRNGAVLTFFRVAVHPAASVPHNIGCARILEGVVVCGLCGDQIAWPPEQKGRHRHAPKDTQSDVPETQAAD